MQDLLKIFKALSDETRLRVLKLLEHGELCVCDLVAALATVQPKISFHLGILKDAGFIKDRKQGKWVHYRIDESDLFRRFLVLSTLERIDEAVFRDDRRRLEHFIRTKTNRSGVRTINKKVSCCLGMRREIRDG